MISFQCECGRMLKVKESLAGRLGKCPQCGKQVRIPGGQPPEPVATPRAEANAVAATSAPEDHCKRNPSDQAFYYRRDGQMEGPAHLDEIRSLVRQGAVREDDKLWVSGSDTWLRAGDMPELRSEFEAPQKVTAPKQPASQDLIFIPATGALVRYAPGAFLDALGGPSFLHRRYAGFWARFFALSIDLYILSLPCAMAISLASGLAPETSSPGSGPLGSLDAAPAFLTVIGLSYILIGWLYFSLLESSPWQATLGKRAMSIFTCSASGQRLSFGRASGRYFLSVLSVIVLSILGGSLAALMVTVAKTFVALTFLPYYSAAAGVLGVAGFLMGAFTRKRQSLHDTLVESIVLYGRKG